MTEKDRSDLALAEQMVSDGKSLRQRVLARIRQRKWRERQQQEKAQEAL